VHHVNEIKPFLKVAERSGNCNAPDWLRKKVDLNSEETKKKVQFASLAVEVVVTACRSRMFA